MPRHVVDFIILGILYGIILDVTGRLEGYRGLGGVNIFVTLDDASLLGKQSLEFIGTVCLALYFGFYGINEMACFAHPPADGAHHGR